VTVVNFDFKIDRVIKHLTTGYYPKKHPHIYVPHNYLEQFNNAYDYFREAKVKNPEDIDISFNNPKIDDVYKILHLECNFDFNSVKNVIQKLIAYNTRVNNNKPIMLDELKLDDISSTDTDNDTDSVCFDKNDIFENFTSNEIEAY
jgi:hypothetical protein